MDLNHLHLHVSDVAVARRFYEDLFGFTERIWHGPILFLTNEDGFDLALAPDPSPQSFPAWFHFGFRLPSIDAVEKLHERAQALGVNITVPLERHEDLVFFCCKDAQSYRIEVYWE